jgi:hypothetical protein
VAHAFWIVWAAKKIFDEASWSKDPSCGPAELVYGASVGYLKRKIRP